MEERANEAPEATDGNRAARRRADRQRPKTPVNARVRDIGFGVTAGIAALGIAVWSGAVAGPEQTASASGFPTAVCCHGETATMTITVRASGSLRAVIGGGQAQIAVPGQTTVATLGHRLADLYPELAPAATLAVAGAGEMLSLDHVLSDGEVVELIPPMAGG